MLRLLCAVGFSLGALLPFANAQDVFTFEDVTESSGLAKFLEHPEGRRPWRYAHGAAWGDVDQDGRPDLFAGAFAARKWFTGEDAPVPNGLFLNRTKGFERADSAPLEAREGHARCAGAAFLDLDRDGDLDLVITNHVQKNSQGSRLLENLGEGRWRDATPDAAPWSSGLGLRNVAGLDANRDGRIDLVLTDGSYGRGAEERARLWLLINRGDWKFEDGNATLGLPLDHTHGLGLAVGDVNDDGWFDLFVAGCNRLFVTTDAGQFREAHPGRFQMKPADVSEGVHCGAAFGDLNGDGRLDLVTSEHGVPARLHVFENRGIRGGLPELVDVSEGCGAGGLLPRGSRELPIKTAHIAIRDMNNDGRSDLVTTLIAVTENGSLQPVVLRSLSSRGRSIQLSSFPADRLTTYYAPGPVADFDRDGRLDLFLPSWFETVPSRLYRNATAGGRWLTVRIASESVSINSMGLGAIVRAYEPGRAGEPDALIARGDIAVGTGYASGEEALAHLGLGERIHCDLVIHIDSHRQVVRNVSANQLLVVKLTP